MYIYKYLDAIQNSIKLTYTSYKKKIGDMILYFILALLSTL